MSWNKYVIVEVTEEETESQFKSIFVGIYLGITAVAIVLLAVSAIVDGTHDWQLPWWTAHFWYSIGWLALSLIIRKIKYVLVGLGLLLLALLFGPAAALSMVIAECFWIGLDARFDRLEGKKPERISWPLADVPIHKRVVRVFFALAVTVLTVWLVYSYTACAVN